MPFYSFQLNVPAPPDVVSERVRRVVQRGRSVWGLAQPAWATSSATTLPFVGAVENRSFQIRRSIRNRNSFMPIIRGRIEPTTAGSTVKVFMFMHPLVLAFMLIWLGALVHIESRVVDANIARSFLPLLMIVSGAVLSLGSFFFEAMRVVPALSAAVFDSTTIATGPDPVAEAATQQSRANQSALMKRIGSIGAAVVAASAIGFLVFHTLSLGSSGAAVMAMGLLSRSAEARAALGRPIKAGFAVDGTVEDKAAEGTAILSIPVSGPTGKGLLFVIANRDHGDWVIEREVLQMGSGSQKVDLTPPTRPEPFHYPATGRVYLLPLDDAAAAMIRDFPAYYKARLDADTLVLPTQELTPDLMSEDGKQAVAERLLMAISAKQSVLAEEPDAVLVGVTSKDVTYDSLDVAYGTNLRQGRFSLVSTARLSEMPWYGGHNPEVAAIRTRKMITRNIGLLRYPLDISKDPTSAVSSDVHTPAQIDRMTESFAGQNGVAEFEPLIAPCVSIVQSANGKQVWRLGCIGNNRPESRLEHFELFTANQFFVMSRADFEFKDQPQFPFVRKYRPLDNRSRSFGMGATDSFDILPVGDSATFAWIELLLADGETIHFTRKSRGTSYANAEFSGPQLLGEPFSRSGLRWNGNGWDLTRKDGWTYVFPSAGPDSTVLQCALTGLRSSSGERFSIQRDAGRNLAEIRTPGGDSLKLTHDDEQRITKGEQSSGRTVQYEYDEGMLVHMRDSQGVEEYYQYDEKSRLIRIQNARHETILANSYDIADLLTSQTLADGGKILYEYGFNQEHTLAFVRITFPNQFSIVWQLTRFGFVRTWPRPPANPAAATPTE